MSNVAPSSAQCIELRARGRRTRSRATHSSALARCGCDVARCVAYNRANRRKRLVVTWQSAIRLWCDVTHSLRTHREKERSTPGTPLTLCVCFGHTHISTLILVWQLFLFSYRSRSRFRCKRTEYRDVQLFFFYTLLFTFFQNLQIKVSRMISIQTNNIKMVYLSFYFQIQNKKINDKSLLTLTTQFEHNV